ncbi:MAG: hypothetical protein IJP66_10035 [Kiritimatiellae bacterium]|nr:hypothetical protein [Kiritimatiellia bacterium]
MKQPHAYRLRAAALLAAATALVLAAPAPAFAAKTTKGDTTITSSRMEYDYARSSIIFEENVKISNPDYTMTCERLVVMLNSTNDVKWIKATKNVILVNGDRSAKCDEATYTKADGKVVMTGREVQVKRAKDQMTGTKITIWLNEERVECEPARMILQETTVNSGKGGAGNLLPK